MKRTAPPKEEPADLRQNLVQSFSIEELKTLCFDLGVDHECIPIGNHKESGARELVAYFERVDRINEFIQRCAELRPNGTWKHTSKMHYKASARTSYSTALGESERFNAYIEKIKSYMRSSEYKQAVSYAEESLAEMAHNTSLTDPMSQFGLAEFEVWYAQALIYTGQTQSAITRLNLIIQRMNTLALPSSSAVEQRWNLIVGRAQNNLGYANWMDLGHYESALNAFRTAVNHFRAANLREELATVYDNMGRVYAELGYQIWAELLIEHGQQLRGELPDIPRRALSLNSNAIAHLAFGEPNHAFELSQEALAVFKQHNNRRGVGLSLLTMGRALRYLASPTYLKRNNPLDRMKKLEHAERVLRSAESNFVKIGERVRLFQAYNELGCVYRERIDLYRQQGDDDSVLRSANLAMEFLEKSVKIAKGQGPRNHCDYPPSYSDACVDLAQTYFLIGDCKNALKWIKSAEGSIPRSYKFVRSVTRMTSQLDRYDEGSEDFWQQLGKAEVLRGRIELDKLVPFGHSSKRVNPRDLLRVITHYTLAAGYFGRFITRPLNSDNSSLYPDYRPSLENHRIFVEQLYNILFKLEPEDLKSIKSEILPEILTQYHLDPVWLEGFYSNTLDLLLNMTIQ